MLRLNNKKAARLSGFFYSILTPTSLMPSKFDTRNINANAVGFGGVLPKFTYSGLDCRRVAGVGCDTGAGR